MSRVLLIMGLALLLMPAVSAEPAATDANPVAWHDLKTLNVEGRGWNNTDDYYRRFPAKAKDKVTTSVWNLAGDSSGMVARFVTDSDTIRVKWKLNTPNLAMNHMPSTGVSGVDLYVRYDGKWRWLAIGIPKAVENETALVSRLSREKREYALYLPLYNGVDSVEVGVSEGATFEQAPPRTRDIKPVVFYGSSITQGGCASRPGMAYPAIIGRHLDIPTINLGFSGNGKCEPEVAELLAELDPQVYVIDCMPNMDQSYVDERIRHLLDLLRQKHPDTPVILVENVIYQNWFIRIKNPETAQPKNKILGKIYEDLKPTWGSKLYYVECSNLYGSDGEATVDGTHATDTGFLRMSDIICAAVAKALDAAGK